MGSELSGNRLGRGLGVEAGGFIESAAESVPVGTVKVSSDCKQWHTLAAGARAGVHPRFVLLKNGSYWRLRRGGSKRFDYAQVTAGFIEMASRQSWFDGDKAGSGKTAVKSVGYTALPATPPVKKRKKVS